MRNAAGKESCGRILKWVERAVLACGILLLGYSAFVLVDAWAFQRREGRDLDRQILVRQAGKSVLQAEVPTPPKGAPAAAGSLIGRIEIPRLSLSTVVVEGTSETSLRRAVGHIPGTALPGEAGDVGLAGHRDTFFRPLKDLKIKDEIQVSTLNGDFRYEVESLKVVRRDDIGVLASSGENVLTLVTCYPFYYVGPAPKRFIVRAREVSRQAVARASVK